jgi:hypothetical protein
MGIGRGIGLGLHGLTSQMIGTITPCALVLPTKNNPLNAANSAITLALSLNIHYLFYYLIKVFQ